MAVLRPWQPTLTGQDQAERFEGQRVSAGYFRVLGVPPILGRDFQASDDQLNGPNVVILSDALWRRRFARRSRDRGRPVLLNDDSYVVIGVMPDGFRECAGSVGRVVGSRSSMTCPRVAPGAITCGPSAGSGPASPFARPPEKPTPSDAPSSKSSAPTPTIPTPRFTVASLRDDLTRGVKPALLAIMGGGDPGSW
jgi:hypothetical protein